MKKLMAALISILMLLQAGCSLLRSSDKVSPAHYTSTVSTEDCFLCNAEKHRTFWAKHNVGIISLNTFEIIPIEIIRDEIDGPYTDDPGGILVFQSSQTTPDGFQASRTIDPDRAYAYASVYLYGDETWDVEKTAAFLCEECLNQLTESISGNEFGVGIVNLNTKKIKVFERQVPGFLSGDFYIHWDLVKKNKYIDTTKLELLVFYCPPISEREV